MPMPLAYGRKSKSQLDTSTPEQAPLPSGPFFTPGPRTTPSAGEKAHSKPSSVSLTNSPTASQAAEGTCKGCEQHEREIQRLSAAFDKMTVEFEKVKDQFAAYKKDFELWARAIEKERDQAAKEKEQVANESRTSALAIVAGSKQATAMKEENSSGDAMEKDYVLLETPVIKINDAAPATAASNEDTDMQAVDRIIERLGMMDNQWDKSA